MGKTLTKFIVGFVVIGGALAYLVISAMQSSWAYYISVDDFDAKKDLVQNHTLRVAGLVAKDSIARDMQKMQLTFTLQGNATSLPISYTGTVPDNFAEDREVVVEGCLDATGVFKADKLMTKCESKYKAKVRDGKSDKGAKADMPARSLGMFDQVHATFI